MLSRWEELRLIALCVTTDDRHAFERLILAHQDELRRFIYNLTLGDASLTDDIMQETFIKAYISISSFKGLSRFKTWLYRIAINEFNSYTRRRSEELIDENTNRYWERCNSYSPATATDASIDIQHCLASLTANERMVIELFYLEDLPIKKISEITSFPEGTVKSHLARAKARMAETLKKDSYEK